MADNTQLNTLLTKCVNFNGAVSTENQIFLSDSFFKDRRTVLNCLQKESEIHALKRALRSLKRDSFATLNYFLTFCNNIYLIKDLLWG